MPVFQFNPGSPGYISVPGTDDGTLYWNNTVPNVIKNNTLSIQSQCSSYSLIVDMLIQNPFQFQTHPRLILTRGGTLKQTADQSDSLQGTLSNYNLAVALLSKTNDLIVSILGADNSDENIIIPNITGCI
jgi:hypothetical protein